METKLKSLWLNTPSSVDTVQPWLLRVSANWRGFAASHVLFLSLARWDVLPVIKDMNFSQCNRKSFNVQQLNVLSPWCRWDVFRLFSRLDFGSDPSYLLNFPDQKNIRSHPHHHPGHGDHWRLRCVRVLPPQSIHRVSQVGGVRNVPQQTKHRQEEGQPARDGAVLLHGERRFKNTRLLLDAD